MYNMIKCDAKSPHQSLHGLHSKINNNASRPIGTYAVIKREARGRALYNCIHTVNGCDVSNLCHRRCALLVICVYTVTHSCRGGERVDDLRQAKVCLILPQLSLWSGLL